jgi:hypothetical protein
MKFHIVRVKLRLQVRVKRKEVSGSESFREQLVVVWFSKLSKNGTIFNEILTTLKEFMEK